MSILFSKAAENLCVVVPPSGSFAKVKQVSNVKFLMFELYRLLKVITGKKNHLVNFKSNYSINYVKKM